MMNPRWWHVAVVAVSLLVGTVATIGTFRAEWVWPGILGLALYLAVWFVLGVRSFEHPRLSIVYAAFLIVISGVLASFDPNFATMQTITYPLLWSVAVSMRTAIITNVAAAVSVFAGLAVSLGSSDLLNAAFIAIVSLTFSLAMGFWISRIWKLADERRALLEQLEAAQESLAALHRDAGVTSERERLAREIHDTIAQDLTGLVLLTQQARRALAENETSAVDEHLTLLEENARLALTETRALVASTAPTTLDDGGIGPALDRLAARFARETGIAVDARVELSAPIDRSSEVVLLRCTQEGLANVRKHSGASRAQLTLTVAEAGITLTLADDGSGFDPSTVRDGYGLSGMRDRLALVNGDLDLETSPSGTRLIVTLPLGASV